MNFQGIWSGVVCKMQNLTQRRLISEYAKKMGYKPKPILQEDTEFHPVKQAVFIAAAGLLIWDIMRDRRKHREALMENFDKTYTNFERDNVPFRVPNMDFMVEQVFKLPRGGENEEGERFRHRPTDNYGKVLHPQDSQ